MQEHLRVDMHPAETDTIVNHLIPCVESIQFYGCFSLSFSSSTFLLRHSQSQSKAFLHGKDAFAFAYIIVQIPPMEWPMANFGESENR
jgi:hypothetical protein